MGFEFGPFRILVSNHIHTILFCNENSLNLLLQFLADAQCVLQLTKFPLR